MKLYTTKLCNAIKAYFIPQVRTDFDRRSDTSLILACGRERILTALWRFTSLFAIFGMASIMENLIRKSRWELGGFYLSMTAIVFFISLRRKINYATRCFFFLAMVYILAVVDLMIFGVAEDWRLYLFAFSILTTIFIGWKAGITAVLICELTFIFIAWQISVGNIVITASAMESPVPTKEIIFLFAVTFMMVTGVVISAVAAVMREFETAWRHERQAVGIVQLERDRLEQRVADRTKELQNKNTRLEAALQDIKTLEGFLPICAQCKKIRDDNGYWNQIESYISEHSEAEFSHSICPDCARKLYPDLDLNED